MHPHFSLEYNSLLCKDSGGCGGIMCCPDYTDQSLAELPKWPLPAQGHERITPIIHT